MKTRKYDPSPLGGYAPAGATHDSQGCIIYHDSLRYSAASREQLDAWAESRMTGVRNAALTEIVFRTLFEIAERAEEDPARAAAAAYEIY